MASEKRDVRVTYTNYYFDGRNDPGRPLSPVAGKWTPGSEQILPYSVAIQLANLYNAPRPKDKPLLVISEIGAVTKKAPAKKTVTKPPASTPVTKPDPPDPTPTPSAPDTKETP